MDLLGRLQLAALNPGAFSGHTWHSQPGTNRIVSINPANGQPIAEVAVCSLLDYHQIVSRASTAALQWRAVPAPKRGEVIRQIAGELRAYKMDLAKLVSLEMGKSQQEAAGEVQEMIDIADFAVGQSRMLYGKTMHSERPQHRMYEQWHPYGIVGIISAFNFPVAVWSWNAFIAAICGNVSVWKPSANTPLCAIAVQHLCKRVLQANQCPDIFSLIIPESHAIADAMVNDVHIPLISFTGSSHVGRQVAAKVATRLGKTILELSGNNAIILDKSANLSLAIPSIVFGAVGTAGQRCTSTRRLFVHESMMKQVVASLHAAYQQITIGDPLDSKNLMGPLIDKPAVKQFSEVMTKLREAGATVVFGGEVMKQPGYFVQPTLVMGISNDAPLVQQETFAPILYIMPYQCLEEAISLQNSVAQGLSSALFTQDLQSAEYYLSAFGSDCGIANINIGTSGAEIGGAFGGEKDTGGGREAGSDAWKSYMRRQTNTINWGNELPLAQGIYFL